MQKKFEHKESRGLPGGPNEMFTYVTGVFDIYQAPSNIEGQGMFAGKPFKKGDLIGLAHSNGQPASQLGRMHNHDENSPTMISKKSGNDRFVFAAKDLQPGDELTTNYRMQPELEQPEDFQYGGSVMAPPRKGVRKNPDGSESTHLMATETFDGKNWFSFPTLFQDPDGTWIDMSDRPWEEAYEEAKRRGEVIDFGTDKEAAIKFGEGSWKKQMGGSILPPAIRNMYPTEDTPIYGGIVGESTVTAPRAGKPSISDFIEYRKQTGEAIPESSAYHHSHRPQPMDSNFSFIGADKSGGLGALRAIGKGVKGLLGLRGAADDVAKGFNYAKGYGNPYENMQITDDIFKGRPFYGVDYDGQITKGRLDFVKNLGRELDDANFDANWIGTEHLRFYGTPHGRSVVEVAVPGKTHQTQLFYKSSGLAGKAGEGVGGSTQGLWQPYGGHTTIFDNDGPIVDWFIKDNGYKTYYNSKSFRDISNRLDDLTKQAGFDLSGQAYKYQKGGSLPTYQDKGEVPNSSNLYPLNAQGIPMDMLDEIVVKPSNFQTWWNKFRNLQKDNPIIEHFTNPLIAADNAIQILQIPSNLVRESIEGIGGKGDGEFNLGNIVPDIGGSTILDDTEAQVPVSQVLGVKDPKGAVGVDILTDPLTYVGGAGIGKNIIQKAGTRVIPKIIKPITTVGKLDNLPQYVKNVPVGNSNLSMTHAMPGLVPEIKGTKDGVLIAHAAGPGNNHMTLKKFLDATTSQDYYSFTESFIDNPMLAGRTFKMAEDLIPKGSILKQPPGGTLSQDSFNLMTRRLGDTRRFRDLTNYDDGYISLNEYAKGRIPLGNDRLTFTKNELNALNAQYRNVFNNLGISEFGGLGSRQVPVLNGGNWGTSYNPFQIRSIQSITDPRALEKYYHVSVPNITLQKLYQKGGEKTSWLDYANPFNWGVYTYDDAGTFGEAFAKAREEGQDQFMYYGDRYTTELAPTPEVKEEPKEEKLFYNKDILKGLSEEQVARRQSLLNAANAVAAAQGDDDNLRKLLVMSAVMENTLGADPKAYGRDYTRSPMSIDDVAYDDLFNLREGAKGYTAQQKKNATWLEGLGINASDVDSLLRADDPMASMAVARLVYGRAPEALPSGDDPDALYNYYLKYYNKGGVDKYGGAEAHRKKFNDYYNQIYREFGGETDQLKIYKDYVYGVYDGTEMQSKAQKVYDKLNRVYYKEAKQSGTTVPNYILSKVMKQSDN
jgi:hypothetical protein